MNKTTENLIQALSEYKPPETVTVTYRLVYDVDTGKPITVTTDKTDKPYIEISRQQADTQPQFDPRARVENGKLIIHTKRLATTEQPNNLTIVPDINGNIATNEYNMLIINSNGKNKWNFK